jgi:hypothetical protein
MTKPIVTIVPAQPGFSLAYFEPEHNHHAAHFLYVPVVAWRIESFSDEDDCAEQSNSYPIGADGETSHEFGQAVRYPDGRFVFLGAAWRDNEAEALTYAAAPYEAKRAAARMVAS